MTIMGTLMAFTATGMLASWVRSYKVGLKEFNMAQVKRGSFGWVVNGLKHGTSMFNRNSWEVHARGRLLKVVNRDSVFHYPNGPYKTSDEMGIMIGYTFQGLQYKKE